MAKCSLKHCENLAEQHKTCDFHYARYSQGSRRTWDRIREADPESWRAGARSLTSDGYAQVRLIDSGPWTAEHRVAMEQKLGRSLATGESVHHVNGIRDDNRPENLELWVGPIRYGQRAADIVCGHCGEPYLV